MKILVLGANGMAGHLICHYLMSKNMDVTPCARSKKVFDNTKVIDFSNTLDLEQEIKRTNYDYIINCAGKLNDDANQNALEAITINSLLPHQLARMTSPSSTRIIHLSTDCVFSGKDGSYSFSSNKDGHTVYDQSKSLGELIDQKNITFRNSIIGPDINPGGIGLFNWFMSLDQKKEIFGFKNVFWSGLTTLELAKKIYESIDNDLKGGLYQLSNNQKISKHDLLVKFNYVFNRGIKIKPTNTTAIDKSLLSNSDLTNVPSYDQMLVDLKEWIINYNLYKHYKL